MKKGREGEGVEKERGNGYERHDWVGKRRRKKIELSRRLAG